MADCQCNGRCVTEDWAAKLLRAARRQLRANDLTPTQGLWLTATVHALEVVLAGPTDQRVVAPLVKPGAVCALPADGAEACPT